MDNGRRHMSERILSLTLEIIYLLTGEDYIPARKSCDDVKDSSDPEKLSQARSRDTELPHPAIMEELKNDEKILDLTNKIIELLTGEVPLRYEDIIVCFTMEEWEYVEGHKEFYMDIIKEDQEPMVRVDTPQPHTTDDDGGDDFDVKMNICDGQSQSIFTNNLNTCKPVESMAWNMLTHTRGTTTSPVGVSSPEQMKCESILMDEGSPMKEEKHLKPLETKYSSSQIKEESFSSEDSHSEDASVVREDCQYLYITEDGNTHVGSDTLTIMACSDCGDRFTVESQDGCFETLQPYRCCKCSSCNVGTHVREAPTVAIPQLPRTSSGDRKKSFVSRKHVDSKKIIRRTKACSYPKWGGYSEDSAPLDSFNMVPEEQKMFICSHCGKCFNHETSLELHQKTHIVEKASFLRNKALLKSHQPVHTGGKQYSCSECGKSFKRSLSLVEHMQLHTGERAFTCPDCGQHFTQRSAYIAHHNVHRAGKLNFCFQCGKSFRTKADLTTHERIHMGETPFPCPECGENFTRRANLVRHQRIHTGEKPFSCPDCGKCFTRKLGLMKHQKIHSGEKVYKRGYRKNAFSMYRVIV